MAVPRRRRGTTSLEAARFLGGPSALGPSIPRIAGTTVTLAAYLAGEPAAECCSHAPPAGTFLPRGFCSTGFCAPALHYPFVFFSFLWGGSTTAAPPSGWRALTRSSRVPSGAPAIRGRRLSVRPAGHEAWCLGGSSLLSVPFRFRQYPLTLPEPPGYSVGGQRHTP